MVELRREVFKFILLYIKWPKLASETSSNQSTIPV